MLDSHPLFKSVFYLATAPVVPLVLVLFCGISSIIASAKGSPRFRFLFGALIGAILISFSAVWLLYEVVNANIHFIRSEIGNLDPAMEASDYSALSIGSAQFILIGIVGLLLMVISLLIRKPAAGSR